MTKPQAKGEMTLAPMRLVFNYISSSSLGHVEIAYMPTAAPPGILVGIGVWSPTGGLHIGSELSSLDTAKVSLAAVEFWTIRHREFHDAPPPTTSPEPERLHTEPPSGFEVAKALIV